MNRVSGFENCYKFIGFPLVSGEMLIPTMMAPIKRMANTNTAENFAIFVLLQVVVKWELYCKDEIGAAFYTPSTGSQCSLNADELY